MELQEAILKRRAVRKFTDYYVADNEILQILEAARWAPSWSNTQAWEFIVVRDKNLIEQITATYSETNPARKCSLSASALIIACAKNGLAGCKESEERTKFNNWFMYDLGSTVQNLCLKAHELGLGTVIVGLLEHDKCSRILELPDDYETVVSIPIGKALNPDKPGPQRKELKDFVHLNKFKIPFIKGDF